MRKSENIDVASQASPQFLRGYQGTLLAAAAGVMGASCYYAQPLLAVLGAYFKVGATRAGILVTLVQLGYGLGVLLLAPLGDHVDRRKLASTMAGACSIALLVSAFSPAFGVLAFAGLVTGITASATMVITPYVAAHSAEFERGRRVGQVMSGILVGVLLARTMSAVTSDLLGWRAVFLIGAAAAALQCAVLRSVMVAEQPRGAVRYGRLIGSVFSLIRTQPELRRRACYSLLAMCGFSMMWTALTYLLTSPPYSFLTSVVGTFGLIGVAGAAAAFFVGRLGDRGWAEQATGALALLLVIAWGFLAFGRSSLGLLITGVFLLDFAAPGLQVVHQSVIYRLSPEARSRITAVFITSTFIGMSLGAAVASVAFAWFNWTGVWIAGLATAALVMVLWCAHALKVSASTGAVAELIRLSE